MTKHRIGTLQEIPEDEGIRVELQGRDIAIHRRGNSVYAVGDSCPHMGASLAEGYLDGEAVVCPWHGWVFDLKDGTSPFDIEARIPVYRVVVENNEVFVEIDAAPCPAEAPEPS